MVGLRSAPPVSVLLPGTQCEVFTGYRYLTLAKRLPLTSFRNVDPSYLHTSISSAAHSGSRQDTSHITAMTQVTHELGWHLIKTFQFNHRNLADSWRVINTNSNPTPGPKQAKPNTPSVPDAVPDTHDSVILPSMLFLQ